MMLRMKVEQLLERITALDRLTDAKFVTFRTLIDSQAEKVKLALDAAQTAIDKAEIANEKSRDRLAEDIKSRFESVNEFRGQQKDIIATFMPRAEFDAFRRTYSEQHALLRDRYAEEISELKGRLDKTEGKGAGLNAGWGYLLGAVGVVGAVIAILVGNN